MLDAMSVRDLADIAIEEDLRAPFLWIPEELFAAFCEEIDQHPNLIGAVIYRNKTVRAGAPFTDITTAAAR